MADGIDAGDETPLFCDRCARTLTPGTGDFYVVRIEAVADPTPPAITADDLASRDVGGEIARLLEDLQEFSEQELLDQVYRRVVLSLCRRCFHTWIERPAG